MQAGHACKTRISDGKDLEQLAHARAARSRSVASTASSMALRLCVCGALFQPRRARCDADRMQKVRLCVDAVQDGAASTGRGGELREIHMGREIGFTRLRKRVRRSLWCLTACKVSP